MPDQPDLTPEQEQEVRRLLADARHTEPMPADVATRLDRVLADLAAQHGDTSPDDGTDSVVAMASRRRRRVTSLLVAAAAVVAVGVGLDQVVDTGGSGDSASTADRAQVAESAGSGSDRGKDEPKPNTDSLTGSAPAPEMAFARPVRVRPDHFSADVARAQRLTHRSPALDARELQALKDARGKVDCTPGDWGSGTFVPVVYGRQRGVLAFRAVNGDTQVVDLFGCGGSAVLRSITLPAP